MGGTKEIDQDGSSIVTRQVQWVLIEAEAENIDNDHDFELIDSSDFDQGSDNSVKSSSSSLSDIVEDASSSSTSSSSSSYGPLYELSELMAQLPIKRGLSQYYQGKSQSFASLTSVDSLEDLAKKGNFVCYNKRRKFRKSFGDGQIRYGPKATIAKKTSRLKRELEKT